MTAMWVSCWPAGMDTGTRQLALRGTGQLRASSSPLPRCFLLIGFILGDTFNI